MADSPDFPEPNEDGIDTGVSILREALRNIQPLSFSDDRRTVFINGETDHIKFHIRIDNADIANLGDAKDIYVEAAVLLRPGSRVDIKALIEDGKVIRDYEEISTDFDEIRLVDNEAVDYNFEHAAELDANHDPEVVEEVEVGAVWLMNMIAEAMRPNSLRRAA